MSNRNNESDAFKEAIRRKVGEDTPLASEKDNVIWENLLTEIDTGKVVTLRKKRIHWYVMAAGIALLLSLGIGVYQSNNDSQKDVLVDDDIEKPSEKNLENSPNYDVVDEAPSYDETTFPSDTPEESLASDRVEPVEVATREDLLLYTLSDSSVVTMNAATAIRTSKTFGSERKVFVHQGEVFFEIRPDKNRPFIVYFDEYKLEVVGTKFNVRNLASGRF